MARGKDGGGIKKGRKNRKHGGNKKSHSMIRYNAEKRCDKNKARNIARDARRKAKKKG